MANYIRLKYIELSQLTNLAKPVLADRDGEVNTNWVTGGTHSVTADATHAHAGSKSFKLTATGNGDFTTNYASLASGNNATFVAAKKYCLAIWTYSETAATVAIKTGGVTSANITAGAAWSRYSFVFVASSATTALQIISNSVNVWFELEPIYEYEDFNIASEKGLHRADRFSMYPEIINQALDGSAQTQYKATIRKALLRTVALTDAQLKAYYYWTLDNDRLLDYDIYSVLEYDLVLIPPPEQEAPWYDDLVLTPYLELDMSEGIARTAWPT